MTDDDNDSHLAEAQIERERQRVYGRRGGGGASADDHAEPRDARVSAALRIGVPWVLGLFGSAILWIGMRVNNSIDSLNVSIDTLNIAMAKVIVRLDQKDTRDDQQDRRADRQDAHLENTDRLVSDLKGDVKELQGKTFRGVAGYGKEEPKRGR